MICDQHFLSQSTEVVQSYPPDVLVVLCSLDANTLAHSECQIVAKKNYVQLMALPKEQTKLSLELSVFGVFTRD